MTKPNSLDSALAIILPALRHASRAVQLRRSKLQDDVDQAFTDLEWAGLEPKAPQGATVPAAGSSERPPLDVTGLYALICVVGALSQGLVS